MPKRENKKIVDVWPLGKTFGYRFKEASYFWNDLTILKIRRGRK
tara:strand:+ start:454 stop:585 length:132 start_codon:yes stop_codon:yes gene_type:complete